MNESLPNDVVLEFGNSFGGIKKSPIGQDKKHVFQQEINLKNKKQIKFTEKKEEKTEQQNGEKQEHRRKKHRRQEKVFHSWHYCFRALFFLGILSKLIIHKMNNKVGR